MDGYQRNNLNPKNSKKLGQVKNLLRFSYFNKFRILTKQKNENLRFW